MALFGNLVSSLAGRAVAKSIGGASAGPVGMAIGAALPLLARRLGPIGMVGLAAGAWAVGKFIAKQAHEAPATQTPKVGMPLPDLELGSDPAPHRGSSLQLERR